MKRIGKVLTTIMLVLLVGVGTSSCKRNSPIVGTWKLVSFVDKGEELYDDTDDYGTTTYQANGKYLENNHGSQTKGWWKIDGNRLYHSTRLIGGTSDGSTILKLPCG